MKQHIVNLSKSKIIASTSIEANTDLKEYEVSVNFAGYIGADETYTVYAENDEAAESLAVEMAREDLNIEDIDQVSDDEYVVTISFCDFIGVEEEYTVYADDETEAEDLAREEALSDLTPEIVSEEDEEL